MNYFRTYLLMMIRNNSYNNKNVKDITKSKHTLEPNTLNSKLMIDY